MENKRLSTIELWRFIFVVALAIGNLNLIIWGPKNVNLIFNGSYFIAFFMFLAGYFLMSNYQKNKEKNKNKSVGSVAWSYTKKRFSQLYPVLLGGTIFAFIARNVVAETKASEVLMIFMNSIWEFFGLGSLGLTNLWNAPLVYISALFIVSFILYYIVNKSEDFFKLFAVLCIILVYGTFGLNAATWSDLSVTVLGIPFAIARLMAGMCVGMLMYYLVEYFKKKEFTENITMVFSFLHIALAMFLLYFWFHGGNWNEPVFGVVLFVFLVILLVNKDYISVLYNDSEICNGLGKLSLYFFVSHIAFVYLLAYLFPEMTYVPSIIFNVLFTLCWSFIMYYIDEYLVTPIFRLNKETVVLETKTEEKKVSKPRVKKVTTKKTTTTTKRKPKKEA